MHYDANNFSWYSYLFPLELVKICYLTFNTPTIAIDYKSFVPVLCFQINIGYYTAHAEEYHLETLTVGWGHN